MWNSIQAHAAKHALFYVIAMGLGLQAFGTAFYDNFYNIPPTNMADLGWWQIVALLLKSASFAVGIVVGYLIRSPSQGTAASETKTGATGAPFETPSPNKP